MAVKSAGNPQKMHHLMIKNLNRTAYLMLVFVILLGNFVAVGFSIPLIMLLKPPLIFYLTSIIALLFGIFIVWAAFEIQHLELRHHILNISLIPLLTLINIFLVSFIKNSLSRIYLIAYSLDWLEFFFGFFFVLPYVLALLFRWHKR